MATKSSAFRMFIDSLPWRFFRKLAMVQILVSCFIIVISTIIARSYMKTYLIKQSFDQVEDSLEIIKESFESQKVDPMVWCRSLRLNWKTRYTLMNDEGKVLCDNYMGPEHMDNHSDRPEVIDALNNGKGFSQRYSNTIKSELIYGAALVYSNRLPGERLIVRQAVQLDKLNSAFKVFDRAIWFFLLPLLIITSLLSLWGSLQVSFPLRSLLRKVDHMKSMDSEEVNSFLMNPNDEWDIVERTLDKARGHIEKYLNELSVENEKISALLESISDSIVAIDRQENVLFLNNQFKKNFLNRDIKKDELHTINFSEIIRHYDIKNLIKSVLETKSPVRKRGIELPIKNGSRTGYFTIKLSPMFDSKKQVFGIVAVFADTTDQKMAEQMREDFVANVSHEVRTPLTSLKGYVQMLQSFDVNDKTKEYLSKIEMNSDRLTALFQDILNLSVIESTARVQKEAVSVEDLTQTTISNLKNIYHQKKLIINSQYGISTLWANSSMMEQVLNNLLENAIKYTPEQTKIEVCWSRSLDNKFDILEIIDNGPGIEKQHLSRLFERFYRVDPSRSREQGGTGLGLSIVKHIVQIHDGVVSVSSEIGVGTRFKIELPAYNPNA